MEMSILTSWEAERPLLASHSRTAWWKTLISCLHGTTRVLWLVETVGIVSGAVKPYTACNAAFDLYFGGLKGPVSHSFYSPVYFDGLDSLYPDHVHWTHSCYTVETSLVFPPTCRWTLYNLGALILACLRYNVVIGYESHPFSEIQIFPKLVVWELQALLCTIKCMKHMIICHSLVIASLGVC